MDVENIKYSSDNIDQYIGNKGLFIDKRDGKKYIWIKIGEQIWMAENLRYKTDTGCVAYKYSKRYVKHYGYLYNGNTAQIVCPKGWHLPTKQEYERLCKFLGNDIHDVFEVFKNDKSIGFNSINAGSYNANTNKYRKSHLFRLDEYWSSSISCCDNNSITYFNTLTINYYRKIALVGVLGLESTNIYIPIRCIKDD
jgi:uncharacterized protein (TIGR02145 family)